MDNYISKRFGNGYTDEFPEVTYYKYPENLSIRGISNRSFRWKDVYILSDFLLREITSSGGFETTSLTGSITTDPVVLSDPSTDISGWHISGQNAYYIGISGSYFSGYESWAYPIMSNSAVMLNSTGTEVIVSQTGIDLTEMPLERSYQFYMVARALSGTGKINPYISYESETSFYDPYSGSWQSQEPTGSYTVSPSGYTEIFYKFDTYGITPTGFKLIVSHPTGENNPVIIDDTHLDEILIRNPYLDFFLPTGYILQITPDLGWHDIRAMFDSPIDQNPHLKTLGMFSTSAGSLDDRLDGSVQVTLDEEIFKDSMFSHYKNYYWRAIAISPNGQAGNPGLPQKFQYIGSVLDREFSITSITEDPFSIVKTIRGRKPSRSIILVDEEVNDIVQYINDTYWSYTTHLDTAFREVSFRARDEGGATSSIQYVKLSCETFTLSSRSLWNVFDDHGVLLDINRLPLESNLDYFNRIKDVNRSPSSPSYLGVLNGANRELGILKIPDALTFSVSKNIYGTQKPVSIDIETTAKSFRIRTEIFRHEELKRIDPIYNTVSLAYYPNRIIEVRTEEGVSVSPHNYSVMDDMDKVTQEYTLTISSNSGEYVYVVYDYFIEIFYSDFPNIGELYTHLLGLKDPSNRSFMTVVLNKKLSGIESCRGLFKDSIVVFPGEQKSIGWSPIFLDRISDRNFRQSLQSAGLQPYQTDYYRLVKELKSNIRIFWGSVETDKDYWGISDSVTNSLDHIPTVLDPTTSNYIEKINPGYSSVSSQVAWRRDYTGMSGDNTLNYGVKTKDFHPGVGYKNDLIPGIWIGDNNPTPPSTHSYEIGKTMNNNNFIYFSGQR